MRRILLILTLSIAALPAVFIAVLVAEGASPIPARDDWEMAPLIIKAHSGGGLSFHDVFAQQQESRTFFAKLIFLLLASGRHWDVRAEMALSIAICCATAVGIFFLLRRSGFTALGSATLLGLMTPLIFSPTQNELWLLASGFPSFVPALCVVVGLLIVQSSLSTMSKFAACAGLAIFSSFTLASGLLAWGLTFPLLFLSQRNPRWRLWFAAWWLVCVAALAVYFFDYKQPVDLPPFAAGPTARSYIDYVFAFLGAPLTRSSSAAPLVVAVAVGAVALLVFALAAAALFRTRELFARGLPWLALGGYSISCAILAALGRIAWGTTQALESRYVAFALYLFVADIALVAIAWSSATRSESLVLHRIAGGAGALLTAAYVLVSAINVTNAIPEMRFRSDVMRMAHVAVLFSDVIDTSDVIEQTTYPRPNFVRAQAVELDRLHLLRPGLLHEIDVTRLRHTAADNGGVSGWFDELMDRDSTTAVAHGWAILQNRRHSAACVALAHSTPDGRWKLFKISQMLVKRADVAARLADGKVVHAGWSAKFPRNLVPPGATITAWAVDAHDGKLFRLKSSRPDMKL